MKFQAVDSMKFLSCILAVLVALCIFPAPGAVNAADGPATVYVDDDWAGLGVGELVYGHTIGTDAFATIQEGIDAVVVSGTVLRCRGNLRQCNCG